MEASPAGAECVRVVVRCRPLNRSETSDGRKRIVDMDRQMQQVRCLAASRTLCCLAAFFERHCSEQQPARAAV